MTAPPALARPRGLGTAAARVHPRPSIAPPDPFPDLDCPAAVRVDEALGDEVNDRLVGWARRCGFDNAELAQLRETNFGRFAMLAHPDTDDPDRLLATGSWTAALYIMDDHYVDDEHGFGDPARAGARLTLATAAVDPAYLLDRYQTELDRALRGDPILVALRTSIAHLSRYATADQIARVRHENAYFFTALNGEVTWRTTGAIPPVWEFLAARQINSFQPCITTTDIVGGYHLPPELYYAPPVRRAAKLAALTTVIVNDLYSMAKESRRDGIDGGLPLVVAHERGCSLDEAARISVRIHNDLMREFEAEHRRLALIPSPELHRYLAGVRAWLGGCREFHRSSARYRDAYR